MLRRSPELLYLVWFAKWGQILDTASRRSLAAGSNDVPSNDAVILQLQLSKDQEKVVEAMKGQREEVRETHRLFGQQQEELLRQQREILTQQRKMHDYMEQVRWERPRVGTVIASARLDWMVVFKVKAQYNILLDTVKQMSMQNLQEELDGHRGVSSSEPGGPRGLQQALSLHKVDMEASVMEVNVIINRSENPYAVFVYSSTLIFESKRVLTAQQVGHSLVACGRCGPEEYCDFSAGRPRCEKCTVCPAGFFLVAQCSVHADRICQVRPKRLSRRRRRRRSGRMSPNAEKVLEAAFFLCLQDRDECLELADLCEHRHKCVNTPGNADK